MFLRHDGLALSYKNGKLRLAGAKRPGVFRVPLEDMKEIHWHASGWQVDFLVEEQNYPISFLAPQSMHIMRKMVFWTLFGKPGVFVAFHLLKRRRAEINEMNSREAEKWRAILRNNHD